MKDNTTKLDIGKYCRLNIRYPFIEYLYILVTCQYRWVSIIIKMLYKYIQRWYATYHSMMNWYSNTHQTYSLISNAYINSM